MTDAAPDNCMFCYPGKRCREHATRPKFTERLQAAGLLSTPPAPRPATVIPINASRERAYAISALEKECGIVVTAHEGERNTKLNNAALSLARFVNENILTATEVKDALAAAGRACGLPQSEIDTCLKGDRHQRDAAAKSDGRPAVPPPTAADYGNTTFNPDARAGDASDCTAVSEIAAKFIAGGAFVLDIPDAPPAIWGDGNEILWMEGESLMIAGPMGLGKTTLAGLLMRGQLGIGDTRVLGLPVTPAAGRILYLAMDRPAQARRAMNRQFTTEHRATLDERLVVWPGPPPADIAQNPELLRQLAELAGADVVYLDSVKDAAIGLSEDAVGAGYNRARQHLLASGRQLAELHHTTKRGANGGPPKDVADIYGSAWIANGTGSIILLTGEPGDPIVGFRHVRQPANEVGPWRLHHDQDAGQITVHHGIDLAAMAADGPDGITAFIAAGALFGADRDGYIPTRADIEKARYKLDKLAGDGLLTRVDGGRGRGAQPARWYPHGIREVSDAV